MSANPKHPGRFGRGLAALVGVPVLLILAAFFTDALAWPWALAIAGGTLLAISFILWRHFHHQDEWVRYVSLFRQAQRQALPTPPSQRGSLLSAEFDAVLVETLRERQARRQELENLIAGGEAILAALPDPLLLLGADSQVRRANDAARDLFAGEVEGRALTALLRDPELLQALEEVLAGNESRSVEFSIPGRIERCFLARVQRLEQEAPDGTLVILALQELTAIKRAEQMRADFVANVSHELRTPLSSLIGFLETLAGPAKDDAEARQKFLAIMREESRRMSRLIDDLLSLSRIELYEHTAPEGEVELSELLGAVVLALELKARERQVRLILSAKELPPVKGARDELAQVFQNLIDNAIKYGRVGGEVRIEAKKLAAGEGPGGRVGRPALAVSISDEGEGIAREHLPRLTERFYRVDTARSRDLGGTGLGLAIVKHIVNRHRGHLEVESTPGQGSRFTVVLKAAPQPAQ